MKNKDGIKLTSILHPEPNGLEEIFYCDPKALETIKIPKGAFKKLNKKLSWLRTKDDSNF